MANIGNILSSYRPPNLMKNIFDTMAGKTKTDDYKTNKLFQKHATMVPQTARSKTISLPILSVNTNSNIFPKQNKSI